MRYRFQDNGSSEAYKEELRVSKPKSELNQVMP